MCVFSNLVCAASEDRCLHIFSGASGRRLCPAIVLSSPASHLLCSAVHVMVVTSHADVFVWFVYYMTFSSCSSSSCSCFVFQYCNCCCLLAQALQLIISLSAIRCHLVILLVYLSFFTFHTLYKLVAQLVTCLVFTHDSRNCYSASQPLQFCLSISLSVHHTDSLVKICTNFDYLLRVVSGSIKLFHKFESHPEQGR